MIRKCDFVVINSAFFWLAIHTETILEGKELSLIHSRLFLKLQPLSEFIYYFWKEFVNFNKIFIAFNTSGAVIFVLTKWHDLCVYFLERNRSGTGAMLQPHSSTRKNGLFPSLWVALPIQALSGNLTRSHFVWNIHKHSQAPLSCEFWIPDQKEFPNLSCLHSNTGWLTLSCLKSAFCHDHLLQYYFLLLHKHEREKLTPKITLNAKGEITLRLFYRIDHNIFT